MANILVVDDELGIRDLLSEILALNITHLADRKARFAKAKQIWAPAGLESLPGPGLESLGGRPVLEYGDLNADIVKLKQLLARAGYGGLYVLEQDISLASADLARGTGPIEDVRRSIEFLRGLLTCGENTRKGATCE